MDKNSLKKLIARHENIFKVILGTYNYLNPRNRILNKNVEIKMELCKLSGIKIINNGINNTISIGKYVQMKDCKIIFYGNNNHVVLDDETNFNQVEFYFEDDNNHITIGEHTNFAGKAHLAVIEGTSIEIGKDCLLSSDLHFRTGDSHSVIDEYGRRINPSKDISIGNHVWVGTKVTCLKGVSIEDNCIVAATTTLCKHYTQKRSIIAGVPGEIVKNNVDWVSERISIKKGDEIYFKN